MDLGMRTATGGLMTIQDWLGERLSKADFVAHHYGKLPYSQPGHHPQAAELGSWEVLVRLIEQPAADVMVVRQNRQYEGPRPTARVDVERLFAEGYTLLVRHAERHDENLAKLAAGFARDFAAPVNVHMYATPAAQFGFGWHYDCEDVFILQTSGHKEYSLRKNTVNPWPIEEAMPLDLAYPREIMPLMRCRLGPGDWLYIPCGYWHKADAQAPAISLAVGVMTPAAVDLFDALRGELLDSLLWRQRLPICGDASSAAPDELVEQLGELGRQLSADLVQRLTDPAFLTRWLKQQREKGF